MNKSKDQNKDRHRYRCKFKTHFLPLSQASLMSQNKIELSKNKNLERPQVNLCLETNLLLRYWTTNRNPIIDQKDYVQTCQFDKLERGYRLVYIIIYLNLGYRL